MANIKSAKKRAIQSEKRKLRNRMRMNNIRSFVKKVMDCIKDGNKQEAQDAFRVMQPKLMRGQTKGILHANTVSRKLSRISKKIKALS